MDTIRKVNGIDVNVLNAHKKDVGNLISKKLASGERLSAMLKKTTEDYFGTPEKAGRLPPLLERLEKQSTDLTGQLNTPEQVDALRNDIAAKFEELTTIQAEYVAQREAVSERRGRLSAKRETRERGVRPSFRRRGHAVGTLRVGGRWMLGKWDGRAP